MQSKVILIILANFQKALALQGLHFWLLKGITNYCSLYKLREMQQYADKDLVYLTIKTHLTLRDDFYQLGPGQDKHSN